MSKEQDIEMLASKLAEADLVGCLPSLLAERLANAGFGFVGGRAANFEFIKNDLNEIERWSVVGKMTEQGMREALKYVNFLATRSLEYIASQPQPLPTDVMWDQTMKERDEAQDLISDVARWIGCAEEWSSSHSHLDCVREHIRAQPETMGRMNDETLREVLTKCNLEAQRLMSATMDWQSIYIRIICEAESNISDSGVQPVAPEELTREEWDSRIAADMAHLVPGLGANSRHKLNKYVTKLRAATEARVRDDYKTTEDTLVTISELAEERFQEIVGLRTTIAELEKRLEGAYRIGDEVLFSKPCVDHEGRYIGGGYVAGKVGASDLNHPDFVTLGSFVRPRPTPAKLTPEQMAEAWMRENGYDTDSDIGRAAGEGKLLITMLQSGKSIETLYAEIGKGGAK